LTAGQTAGSADTRTTGLMCYSLDDGLQWRRLGELTGDQRSLGACCDLCRSADRRMSRPDLIAAAMYGSAVATVRSQHSQEYKNPRQHCLLCLVTLTFDLLTPKLRGFQDSLWNISMSGLVILAAAAFGIARKIRQTHRQTNAAENRSPHCRHSMDSQYKQPFVFDYEFSV